MAKIPEYMMPDFEGMSRQLRKDFYAREQRPSRREIHARLCALGVKVGAHKKKEQSDAPVHHQP